MATCRLQTGVLLTTFFNSDIIKIKQERRERINMSMVPFIKRNLSDMTKEYLRGYIEQARHGGDEKLPSEVDLAKKLSVSRVTVRRALNDLENEGFVLRIHGKGTFVNMRMLQIHLNLNYGQEFSKVIEESGYTTRIDLQQVIKLPATLEQSKRLDLPEGTPLYEVHKLFLGDSNPCIFCIDWIPVALFETEPHKKDFKKSSFDLIKDQAGVICTRDFIELCSVSRQQMTYFSGGEDIMDCDSLLSFRTINYDQEYAPVFLTQSFYNTNYIHYTLIRNISVYRDQN